MVVKINHLCSAASLAVSGRIGCLQARCGEPRQAASCAGDSKTDRVRQRECGSSRLSVLSSGSCIGFQRGGERIRGFGFLAVRTGAVAQRPMP